MSTHTVIANFNLTLVYAIPFRIAITCHPEEAKESNSKHREYGNSAISIKLQYSLACYVPTMASGEEKPNTFFLSCSLSHFLLPIYTEYCQFVDNHVRHVITTEKPAEHQENNIFLSRRDVPRVPVLHNGYRVGWVGFELSAAPIYVCSRFFFPGRDSSMLTSFHFPLPGEASHQ